MTTWLMEEEDGASLSACASMREARRCLRSSYSAWLKPGVTSPVKCHTHMFSMDLSISDSYVTFDKIGKNNPLPNWFCKMRQIYFSSFLGIAWGMVK